MSTKHNADWPPVGTGSRSRRRCLSQAARLNCSDSRNKTSSGTGSGVGISTAPRGDLIAIIEQLTDQMHTAAAELQFEVAARIRDEIKELKHELRGMQAAGV